TNNAVKFTEQGRVTLRVHLEREQDEPRICFDVEDTGIGIAPEDRERLFDAFTQADGSTTRKYGGTGLGLAITKQLSELLGGGIRVSSELGRGSTFSLTIPAGLDVSAQAPLDRRRSAQPSASPDEETKPTHFAARCLVAEDSLASQQVIQRKLAKLGIDVTLAEDGRVALEKAQASAFDLIFMDIQMPNMNGYEATRAIREAGMKTPIVALTANAMKGDEQKCLDAGCDAYLAKPVESEKLLDMLRRYLEPASGNGDPWVVDRVEKIGDDGDTQGMMGNTEDDATERVDESTRSPNAEDVISWTRLIEYMDDDEELIRDVVDAWMVDNPGRMMALGEAVTERDAERINALAHSLKGSAATIAASPTSEAASRLETAGREGAMDGIETLYADLQTAFAALESLLSQSDWMAVVKNGTDKVSSGSGDHDSVCPTPL
ncbi:MAG: response regulator, partial [Planctomycetes bacterium]|nr:response regulator [Planctomycetota bacterium]